MNKSEKIKLLADLVAIRSVNDNEAQVAQYLADFLKKYEIESQIITYAPNRANLVVQLGSGHPVLAFSGHEDVVDAIGDWNTDPFILTEQNGKLYGRGTCDMKSGVAAMIIALIELKQSQIAFNGTIRLLITLGEEVGEFGAEQLTQHGLRDDVDGLVIGEPTGYKICYAHKGFLDLQLKSKGKIAHSSMPELGNNALQNMLDLLELVKHQIGTVDYVDPETGKFLFNFTVMQGGTQVNSIPGTTKVELNARTIDAFDNEKVIQIIKAAIAKLEKENSAYDFAMKILMDLPPVDGDKNNALVKLGQEIGKEVSKQDIGLFGGAYTTDAAKFLVKKPKDFPMIIFGPGNQSLHSSNEYIEKAMYFNFIEIYKKLMIEGIK